MNIVQNNFHPIFEADQVLTSDHLNELFNYLEEQERLTRAKLVGAGIVCGLDVKIESSGSVNTVVISKGVGLTSKGYMAVLEGEAGADSVSYPYFTEYTDPNDEVYSFFDGGTAQIPLYELQSQKVIGAEALVNLDLPLTDYGVLLYLECYDKKLKNCIENDCNEKGVERIFTLRKLLVRKSNLRTIICQEEELNTPKSESDIDNYTNARYKLAHINVERFRTQGIPIISSDQLIKKYQDLLIATAGNVFGKLKTQLAFLDPVISKEYDIKADLDAILNNLPSDFGPGVRSLSVCDLQYDYDFFCDLAEAYNELADAAFDMIQECCPALDRFPKHLRLGELSFDASCPPSAYRHRFVHSPIHNDQYKQRDRVVALARKVVAIATSFRTVESLDTIKITPSAALAAPLWQKAIPYYYNISDSLLRNWNSELKRRCLETENLSYHAPEYATADHVLNPLDYGLNKYDFFRIEGHICKDYRDALRDIISERDSNNLPFDVIALKVGQDPQDTDFDKLSCNFRDLEILCEAWKSELLCLMSKVLQRVSSAPVAAAIVADDGAASTKAIGTDSAVSARAVAAETEFQSQAVAGKSVAIFDDAIQSIGTTEDTLGQYYNQAIQQENEVCKYDSNVSQSILQVDGVSSLPLEDVYVAYNYPVELMTALLEFAQVADQDCAEIDIDQLRISIANLNAKAQQYLNGLRAYQARAVQTVSLDYETMSQLSMLVLTNCSFNSLVDIRLEMDRRKEEIMRMNLFHEYVKKNPGIDHKGGVPKGGTFILVYAGDESVTVATPNSAAAEAVPASATAAAAASAVNVSRAVSSARAVSVNTNAEAVEAARAAATTQQYRVSGTTRDDDGNALVGVQIYVEGGNVGYFSDANGNFRVTNIPGGTQTLLFQYAGLEDRRIIVTGNTADLIVVMSTVDPDKVAPGTVIADFFVPYLCCSDCPPVSFIIAETDPTDPVEEVDLTLPGDTFCVPDDKTYAFIVTPTDGVVTGEGVVGNVSDGFAFSPNIIDFGTEVVKEISFKVNDQDVDLKKTVEKKPTASFDHGIKWRIDGDGLAKPFLDLNILEYDSRYSYRWGVDAIIADKKTSLFSEAHPGGASDRTFILDGQKQDTEIQITLRADNVKCLDQITISTTVPAPDIVTETKFEVTYGDSGILKPPYTFINDRGSFVSIRATPNGKFNNTTSFKVLNLQGPSIIGDQTEYRFEPLEKPAGVYTLEYDVDGIVTNLQVNITAPGQAVNFSELEELGTMKNDANLTEIFGAGSLAVENTSGVATALLGRMENTKMAKEITEGAFNETFTESLEPAVTDVVNKVIAINDPNKANNTAAQNTMLNLFRSQTTLILEMIAAQGEDLNTQNPLSKLLTKLKKDMAKMNKAGLKINVGNKTKTAIQTQIKALVDKPKAAKKFKELLAAVTA